MISLEHREAIRRAYFVDDKSMRQIARDFHCSRKTITKAIASAEPASYTLQTPRPSPVLDGFKARIEELILESEQQPRKQQFITKKIFEIIRGEGFAGSEGTVRRFVGKKRALQRRPKVYLPLEFDPGIDAQVDWGEATVVMEGERIVVQIFCMRLCYSRRLFMMAFPGQKQEAFFEGHRSAFHFFAGVPHRIAYDNLKTAVFRILKGKKRREQQSFTVFRSHYLFESRFCTPAQAHEKGSIEHGVGFGRRNFMVPLPEVDSFEELNALLLERCASDDSRRVKGQPLPIGEAWEIELPYLRSLPDYDYDCCTPYNATLNGYCQVVFETNRYSIPPERRRKNLALKAYPFHVEILDHEGVLVRHQRSYGYEEDIYDPLHYLSMLKERLGAFEHARPLRRWRKQWPNVYELLLEHLADKWPDGRGIREFISMLELHRDYPGELIEEAVAQALEFGCAHYDGVLLCVRQLSRKEKPAVSLELDPSSSWATVGTQPVELARYNQLLAHE